MRRALIVSIAILTLMASSAVMAGEQQVSDRLLEILKERQIITENEYAELSDIADQMKEDQTSVDQQLEALDASISEYLAKEGDEDEAGVSVSHKKGKGFGFSTGMFELFVGGLFQVQYYGLDVENGRDTNNFDVAEARLQFYGKAFVEGFSYMFEWQTANGSLSMLDAWANYKITDGVQIKGGQFRTPYSRQFQHNPGKLQLQGRSIVTDEFAPGFDIGLMLHDVLAFGEDGDMAVEWAFALVNGDGANVDGNDNNWLGWVARLGFYPFGEVECGEGDLANTQDIKFGIASSFYSYRNRPGGGETTKTDGLEIDAVVAWSGLYATGEWHRRSVNPDNADDVDDNGWFVQAGFVIPDSEFEVIGRYSRIIWNKVTGYTSTSAWQLGVAWYPGQEGHPFKALIAFGKIQSEESNQPGTGVSSAPLKLTDVSMAYGDTFFLRIAFQLDW